MTPDVARTIVLPYRLDLRRSLVMLLMGPHDPSQRLDAGHYWKATRTPEGPATLHLARSAEDTLTAEAWGPGAAWVLAWAERVAGAQDQPELLVPQDERVRAWLRAVPGLRRPRVPWIHEVLVQVVLQQRVSSTEAFASYARLVRQHGEPAPGPAELRLPVAPRTLAYLPDDALTRAGVDHQRSQCLRAVGLVARRVDELAEAELPEVRRRLAAIRGVGPWTVETTVAFARGDPDAVPPGDYNLPHTVAYGLAGEARGDDARMLALLEPYRGQRGRVIALMEAAGVRAPRYGPRLRPAGPPRRRP